MHIKSQKAILRIQNPHEYEVQRSRKTKTDPFYIKPGIQIKCCEATLFTQSGHG